MKYLKKFESKLYIQQSHDEYSDAIRTSTTKYGNEVIVDTSNNDIARIKSALSKQRPGLKGIKIEQEGPMLTLAKHTVVTDIESHFCIMSIYKTNDEYFHVIIGGDAYKCDQIVGVIELINDLNIDQIIKEWRVERDSRKYDDYLGYDDDMMDEDMMDESISNEYYQYSNETTFKNNIQGNKLVPFDHNDFQVVKRNFNKLSGGCDIDISSRVDFPNDTIATKYGGVKFTKYPQDDRDGVIHIQSFKTENEYFYTKIKYKNIRNYYICDQLYGLIEFMKDCDKLI